MTTYAIHANGTLWGLFAATDADTAIQAAADELGTDGNADALTAETLTETLRRIDRDYRDNDTTMSEGVKKWCNASDVDWDGADGIWIGSPQTGYWLSDDEMSEFILWVES